MNERPQNTGAPPRGTSKCGRTRIGITLAAIIGIAAYYVMSGAGSMPRYLYYGHVTDLMVDGEAVTLGGEAVCKKTRLGINTGFQPTYARASPSTFARRLKLGKTVVATPESFCLGGLPEKVDDHISAVFVFDAGEPPSQVEVHYDVKALTDPKSQAHVTSARDLIAWTNKRFIRVFMVEIDPSVFE